MKKLSRSQFLLIGIMVVSPIVLAIGTFDALWSANIGETIEVATVSTSSSPAATGLAAPNSCQYKGMAYRDGQSFKDECNYCGCSNGEVVCTMMACKSSPLPPPNACIYKGKTYKHGERFKDECNACSCTNGQVACTKMACNGSPSPKPSVTPTGKICEFKGRTFKDGEGFKDDCNSCSCVDGQVACTMMACHSSPLPTPNSCTHKGKTYKHGERFKDECNACSCANGQVGCTEMACGITPSPKPTCTPRPACLDAEPACQLAVPRGGWCPTASPKPTCVPRPACADVADGEPQCAIAEPREGWCPRTSPKPSVTPTGKICEYKGRIYREGEGFKDDCNSCGCANGQVACTMMACNGSPAPTTTAIPPLPGDPMVNDCSLLNAKNPVRPGVGAPFNPFSSDKRLIMRSECAADGFKAKIEGSTQDGKSVAAFRYGFKWNGKTWERFEFVSTASGGTETNTASEFLAQPLVSKDTLTYTGDTTYWLAYTCTYKNKLWKCGCADDTCSRSHWNMQGAVWQPIPVE